MNTIRVLNGLDPDQTWRFVGPHARIQILIYYVRMDRVSPVTSGLSNGDVCMNPKSTKNIEKCQLLVIICCLYLTNVIVVENSVDPDQTAPI